MYEHKSKPLLSREAFLRRMAAHGGAAALLVSVSLAAGVLGYHALAGLSWLDSFLNAAMILGGEGPVDRLTGGAAKVFASLYALYSGIVLLAAVGVIAAPLLHRMLHRLHLQDAGR